MTTAERGYGSAHQRARKQLERVVHSGEANCARCGRRIEPWEPWDLGHNDFDRSFYSGPEHRRCNRATASRGRRLRRLSRRW